MIPSCPPEIKAMMTVPVVWESWDGFDGHAEPSYAPAITLYCFQEAHGGPGRSGGLMAERDASITTVEPRWDLFFDPDQPNVRSIKLYDRFTPGGVGAEAQSLQAVRVNTFYGPPFDNRYPWLVVVSL